MKLLVLAFVACIGAAVMVVIVAEEIHRHRSMLKALPPSSTVAPHEIDAMLREGYPLIAVMGTGSMPPYIPAGEGRVAWVLVDRCAPQDRPPQLLLPPLCQAPSSITK